jgi:hypothetical protein
VEERHGWHRSTRELEVGLIGNRLAPDGRLLDAGCGIGVPPLRCSLAADLRGRSPRAAIGERCETSPGQSRTTAAAGKALLRAKRLVLARTGPAIPCGHTLLALGTSR